MNKLFLAVIALFLILGCSENNKKEKEYINKLHNDNVNVVNMTEIKFKDEAHRKTIEVFEICVNGELIVFIDSYKEGGAVNMKNDNKCKISQTH